MYLMYVDESGDTGLLGSPFFVLSGLVIHEASWYSSLSNLNGYRQRMRNSFGLKLREEIHSYEMLHHPGSLVRIKRNDRLSILRFLMHEIENLPNASVINIVVDKRKKTAGYDVFGMAWGALIQRFENTLLNNNFRADAAGSHGLIVPDSTNAALLTKRLRAMRHYNPVPSMPAFGTGYRNLNLVRILEDPFYRDSRDSFFIQSCDCIAWMLSQELNPCRFIQRKTGNGYFSRLNQCLCRVASNTDSRGIVRL